MILVPTSPHYDKGLVNLRSSNSINEDHRETWSPYLEYLTKYLVVLNYVAIPLLNFVGLSCMFGYFLIGRRSIS